MLPTPAELREQSAFYRDAAREAETAETKQRLAAYALVLSEVAEAMERDERNANTEQFRRILAEALATVLETPIGELDAAAGAAREKAVADARAQIKRWRMRAEEIRSAADQFAVPSAQESLRRAAGNYDKLADDAEAILTGTLSVPSERTG